ncbi:hypothetical protein COU61_02910 [Candidatus Pacearchaeota archaeon CG10_big_fil_rev_8_21_14_0_10_35_13]|nr:MAG: hypothetical protein COU61_02910 [Candidatus Pacearchaeota archaeon CG10_big_fil_rev_8_21_14_0_10_35_13]
MSNDYFGKLMDGVGCAVRKVGLYLSHPDVVGWSSRGEPTLAACSFLYQIGAGAVSNIHERFNGLDKVLGVDE